MSFLFINKTFNLKSRTVMNAKISTNVCVEVNRNLILYNLHTVPLRRSYSKWFVGCHSVRCFSYSGFLYSGFGLFSVSDAKRISWMKTFLLKILWNSIFIALISYPWLSYLVFISRGMEYSVYSYLLPSQRSHHSSQDNAPVEAVVWLRKNLLQAWGHLSIINLQ